MTFSKHFMRMLVGFTFVAACLSGCAGRITMEPDIQKQFYPPPKNELPKAYKYSVQASKDGYCYYGVITVKGSVDDAREEAAERGADAVVLEEKKIEEWKTGYSYSHSIYGSQSRTDVYKPTAKQKMSQGYDVRLYQYNPQKAPQSGLDGCFWPCTNRTYSRDAADYTCSKEDIQTFIDQGADIRKSRIAREFLCYVKRGEHISDYCGFVLEKMQFIADKGGFKAPDIAEYIDKYKIGTRKFIDKLRKEYPNEKMTPVNCSKEYLQKKWFNKKYKRNIPMSMRPPSPGETIWFWENILAIMEKNKK